MNHSKLFWLEVEKVLPDYISLEKELKRVEKTRDTLFAKPSVESYLSEQLQEHNKSL